MSKSKKIIFSLIILFCLSYWIVEKVITANISKAAIIQKLEAVTGDHVVIDGELHWHYSLRPSLDLDKITFSSETSDTISFKNARISLHLIPLLQKLFEFDINFQEWQQNQLHFLNGKAHIEFEHNVLSLTKFESQFYQGKINGEAQIDLTKTTPQFNITLNATQVEIADMLADIAHSASVSGKMNITTNLISQGENAEQFIQNLNGNLLLTVNNGKLNTIHIGNIISNADADFFDHLKINAPIKNGIANATITLLAKNYHADGNGQINFNNQRLNVLLNAYYTRAQQTKNTAIPITISGEIASPSISVDLAKPLSELLNANGIKIKNKLNHLIQQL